MLTFFIRRPRFAMVIALLLSLVMIQNEKQLPRGMRPE